MSTIAAVMTELPTAGEGQAFKVTWSTMLNNDVGEAVKLYGFNDRSVQVEGTFGGATVTMQGSLDETNYETVRDPSSTNLTFAAAGLKAVLEAVQTFRPSVAGGGGTTSLTVTMIAKRTIR